MKSTSLEYIKEDIQAAVAVKQYMLMDHLLLQDIHNVALCCVAALQRGNKILFAGNGGSAADAQHLAAELVGRYKLDRPGLPAMALTTDTSILTALANDFGYEEVFARQLQALGKHGDVFVAISTSGYSPNILRAINQAISMNLFVIVLTGSSSGAPARESGYHYCLSIPSTDTARIQECHIMIGHIICSYIEQKMFPGAAA
jgi:D-sedoheptulose 7-phosphate isomerase